MIEVLEFKYYPVTIDGERGAIRIVEGQDFSVEHFAYHLVPSKWTVVAIPTDAAPKALKGKVLVLVRKVASNGEYDIEWHVHQQILLETLMGGTLRCELQHTGSFSMNGNCITVETREIL